MKVFTAYRQVLSPNIVKILLTPLIPFNVCTHGGEELVTVDTSLLQQPTLRLLGILFELLLLLVLGLLLAAAPGRGQHQLAAGVLLQVLGVLRLVQEAVIENSFNVTVTSHKT